jgi:hypothetical protein
MDLRKLVARAKKVAGKLVGRSDVGRQRLLRQVQSAVDLALPKKALNVHAPKSDCPEVVVGAESCRPDARIRFTREESRYAVERFDDGWIQAGLHKRIQPAMFQFHPWRQGPFQFMRFRGLG